MWAYNSLRTAHFHEVSSASQHTYSLKSRYGKVSGESCGGGQLAVLQRFVARHATAIHARIPDHAKAVLATHRLAGSTANTVPGSMNRSTRHTTAAVPNHQATSTRRGLATWRCIRKPGIMRTAMPKIRWV